MKVLFCHDGPIKEDSNGNYYGLAHNNEMFKRYLSIASEIGVIIRTNRISNEETIKYSKIDLESLKIVSVQNIASIKGQIFYKKNVAKRIEEEIHNADYIVARVPSFIGFLAVKKAIKLGKPYLVEAVACPWDAYWNYSLKGKLVAPFMYFNMRKCMKNAKYSVYVTSEFLQKRYPTRGKSINVSNASLTEFDNYIVEKRLNKISKMNEDQKIIIGTTAAVNVRYKGQQYIIESLGQLKKKGIKNFEYQLVGGGDPEYLLKIAEKHDVVNQVKFLGPMPHKDVFDWLDKIDIYTQPSRQEGLPRALIEAMSRGLPALGARTAGIPELIDEKYIFSNTRKNLQEICEILLSFDKKSIQEQSLKNYKESKKYEKSILDNRRKKFFEEFKNEV